jgi:hypothetical protein
MFYNLIANLYYIILMYKYLIIFINYKNFYYFKYKHIFLINIFVIIRI